MKIILVEATNFVKTQVSKDILKHLDEIVDDTSYVLNFHPTNCKKGLYKFSKIVKVPNKYNLKSRIVKITDENKKYLVSDYVVRRKGEIPYLKRYFKKNSPVNLVVTDHLDVILYDKKQLMKEKEKINFDYGIVAINVESKFSAPLIPQTMINNHLGIKFGGNGEKLNIKEYMKSVKFWKTHAFLGE